MAATLQCRLVLCALIAGVLTALPLALASSNGANAMHTGGPLSNGAGCSACHPYESGAGSVELVDAPRRYRAGERYDLTVRVSDADKVGAGFQISVEQVGGSVGALRLVDETTTEFADHDSRFVTHTGDGLSDSLDNWVSGGNSYDYVVGWEAPGSDIGPVTFFVSANATNEATSFVGENFYWTFVTATYATPGDADGDTDLDLVDFAAFQRCFDFGGPGAPAECEFIDMDDDSQVDEFDVDLWTMAADGPTAPYPAGYVLASAVRGGLLYDKWWRESDVAEPVGDHPLYPAEGVRTGSTTFRCKECHGWDYKGADGVYGSGSHFTGIAGVFGSTMAPQEMFALLAADPAEVPNGHDMDAFGMSDRDLWDVVRFLTDELVETDDFIDANGAFPGDVELGSGGYAINCTYCHGSAGKDINFGTTLDPVYVGTIAVNNPWELLHKMRFGHPGSPMSSLELVGWSDLQMIAVAAYTATLPVD